MSRLMPGHVRFQGIALYEAQAIERVRVHGDKILAHIEGQSFQFSFDDRDLDCSCQNFRQKGFCQHLAAMEYYLKNDPKGQELAEVIQQKASELADQEKQKSLGSQLLDQFLPHVEKREAAYQLQAQGQYNPLDKQILWTLKILRLPDTRAYIIRDIKAFLKCLDAKYAYQIGKNYYEPISQSQFDKASQTLLSFLKRLVPEALDFDSDFILPQFGRYLRLPQGFFEEGLAYLCDLSAFEISLEEGTYNSLAVRSLDREANLFHFTVKVEQTFMELTIEEGVYQPFFQGTYLFAKGIFYHLTPRQKELLLLIKNLSQNELGSRSLRMDLDDKDRLALLLLDLKTIGQVQAPKQFEIYDFRPFFEFTRLSDDRIQLELALDFDRIWVSSQAHLEQLPFAIHYQHLQNIWDLLSLHGFSPDFKSQKLLVHSQDFYDFYTETLPAFESVGEVLLSETIREIYRPSNGQFHLDVSNHFLDISFDFEDISPQEISTAYEALQADQAYYVTKEGKILLFDEETKRVNQTLKDFRAQLLPDGHLKLSSLSALQLAQTIEGLRGVHLSENFKDLVEALRFPERFDIGELPIKAQLRDYQLFGVKWMSMLFHYGLGGILADDMGLGKTLQTIAFLANTLKPDQRVLILAPSSLIYNWQEECSRFAPQMDVAVSYGSKSQRVEVLSQGHQVTVTSYASFRQDFDYFQGQTFDILILDEAQVMKNDQTKIASHLRQFEVKSCFALSGTPVENRLVELWSIFQIVLPDLLPNKRSFNQFTAKQVARIIQPFILRRRKEEVLPELPDLLEMTRSNELTDEQKAIYVAQIQQLRHSLEGASDSEINRKKIEILSAITRLRQICNTPSLFLPDYKGDSGKLESLRQLLAQIQAGGQRVLIFSQFRGMLDIIEQELEALSMTSYKITGSTKATDRQEITRAFNAGSRDAVLVSLKAGGVGINLTGADTVILVDLWWNPTVEDQAISRAYRMGQKRNVECYRLMTRGTIEEKIQALQANKRQLITTVLDGQDRRASLSVEDIREILSLPLK